MGRHSGSAMVGPPRTMAAIRMNRGMIHFSRKPLPIWRDRTGSQNQLTANILGLALSTLPELQC